MLKRKRPTAITPPAPDPDTVHAFWTVVNTAEALDDDQAARLVAAWDALGDHIHAHLESVATAAAGALVDNHIVAKRPRRLFGRLEHAIYSRMDALERLGDCAPAVYAAIAALAKPHIGDSEYGALTRAWRDAGLPLTGAVADDLGPAVAAIVNFVRGWDTHARSAAQADYEAHYTRHVERAEGRVHEALVRAGLVVPGLTDPRALWPYLDEMCGISGGLVDVLEAVHARDYNLATPADFDLLTAWWRAAGLPLPPVAPRMIIGQYSNGLPCTTAMWAPSIPPLRQLGSGAQEAQ